MRWIRTGFQILTGSTMLVVLLFAAGVLWLLETEDKKNPATLY